MKKYLLALVFSSALLGASAQEKGAVEGALRDPQRKAQEAKADRFIHDSRQLANSTAPAPKKTLAPKARKKKGGAATSCHKKGPAR
ncbi:hypothetical protein [Flaviaesturariibacter amylovorans]